MPPVISVSAIFPHLQSSLPAKSAGPAPTFIAVWYSELLKTLPAAFEVRFYFVFWTEVGRNANFQGERGNRGNKLPRGFLKVDSMATEDNS